MSTRIHWLRPIDELAAQKEHGSGKPSLPVSQWPEPRPIAEAPKDGSELLLWCPRIGVDHKRMEPLVYVER